MIKLARALALSSIVAAFAIGSVAFAQDAGKAAKPAAAKPAKAAKPATKAKAGKAKAKGHAKAKAHGKAKGHAKVKHVKKGTKKPAK